MPRHTGTVLLDANVIIEAHRAGVWSVLSGAYRLETVDECLVETQTGFANRTKAHQINENVIRSQLAGVHVIDELQRATLLLQVEDIALDSGELALWAHAFGRDDDWTLCGPDTASLRCGVRLGFRKRLVSLEQLLVEAGSRSRNELKDAYTKQWHANKMSQLVLDENRRR